MTPEQLREHWERAQALEAAGNLDEARAAYDAILVDSPRQILVQLRLSTLEQAAGRYRAAHARYRERIRTFCGEKHVPLVEISTDEAWDQAVLSLLRRGGVVG